MLRAREEFCRLFFDPEVPPGSADGLRRYFYGFAYAARLRHYRRSRRGLAEDGWACRIIPFIQENRR